MELLVGWFVDFTLKEPHFKVIFIQNWKLISKIKYKKVGIWYLKKFFLKKN